MSTKPIKHRTRQSLYHKPIQFVHYTECVTPMFVSCCAPAALRVHPTRSRIIPQADNCKNIPIYHTHHTPTCSIRNTLRSNRKYISLWFFFFFWVFLKPSDALAKLENLFLVPREDSFAFFHISSVESTIYRFCCSDILYTIYDFLFISCRLWSTQIDILHCTLYNSLIFFEGISAILI